MTKLPAGWKRLTRKEIAVRLREARTLLDKPSKKDFGKGHMNMAKERFESDDRTWALQYEFSRSTASRGHVKIVKI